jgi:tetratricopeptide (TPR) repeat protein
MVSAKSFLNKNTNDYTGKNPDYWRANIEMELGNLLIPFTKVCMYISNGEFDKAERLLFIVNYFSAEGTLPDYLSREISAKLGLLKSEIEAEINQGIKLHDQGLYTEAVALYEDLLTSFPKCAWLNYELYFSKVGAENNEDKRVEEWYKIKPIVYECDPMYPMDINATNGTQSYLMFSRNEIGSLFQSKETANKDFVRYADIALDLGNYEFAAQLYWLIIGNISKEEYDNRDMLAHFLYCLDKLGDKEMIKNFKGDYKKEFAKIEKERKKIMEKSTYYKMMK